MVATAGNTYRSEIDGLRGIAVLAVVVFHLIPAQLRGGFVGVDVFFVISGYLITRLLRSAIREERLSFRDFFLRRIRRLAPALAVLVAFCVVAATFALLPADFASFSKSVIAQPLALQNLHFLAEGEYFRGSDLKPLLHTWSLGVEEQFYLFWPFFIAGISRLGRRGTLLWLGLCCVGSFALGLALPMFSPKAAFFLFPARAWELALGGVWAIVEEKHPLGPGPSRWLGGIGIVALVASFVVIDETMTFPGWVALVPALATAATIAAARNGAWLRSALSVRPLVFVGVISYSLYLWHWPIIVFARHAGAEPAGQPLVAALCAIASVAAAWLSYRFVEQPIRKKQWFTTSRRMVAAFAISSALIISAGVLGVTTRGMSFRYDRQARGLLEAPFDVDQDRCGLVFRLRNPSAQVCELVPGAADSPRKVLLWGNSHAAQWTGLFRELAREADTPLFLNARNCRATTDSKFCGPHVQRAVASFIDSAGVTDVVLASSWYAKKNVAPERFEASFREIVADLAGRDVRLWLVVDTPAHADFNPEKRYRSGTTALARIPWEEHQARRARERALFSEFADASDRVRVIDPTSVFCADGTCSAGEERSYYRDEDHLTVTGAQAARDAFAPVFR